MRVWEKVGIFDYQSGNSQGILIHVLGMNPVAVCVTSNIANCARVIGV